MQTQTARKLNELTSEFYARNAASFDATRKSAWNGWRKCLEIIEGQPHGKALASVLDFGCGNLRFETFLAQMLETRPEIWAIDNCLQLASCAEDVHFQQLDIVDTLISGDSLPDAIDAPLCNLTCAFGLMHHVPGHAARKALLDALLAKTRAQGIAIVTLWQFDRDERLFKKARSVTREALERYPNLELDVGDYLLGWQDSTDALRYCHCFSDTEINSLISHAQSDARLLARFNADGRADSLNCYLVFQKL